MNIYWLDKPDCQDPFVVGGKAASLGRLASAHPVPPGFCLAATQADAALTPGFRLELARAYAHLGRRCGTSAPSVAVRSSAVDEDGQQTSFAGLHATYLNVTGPDAVADAVRRCLVSAGTERARRYRQHHGLAEQTRVAVLIQQLVLADVSAVVFSTDPRNRGEGHIVINATWGLGESLVGGTVTPDLYVVCKTNLEIVEHEIADKARMTVMAVKGTREVAVPRSMRTEPALCDVQVTALARLALTLERQQGWPVDLECAYQQGTLYLLQCRPITTLEFSSPN